jgi:DNA mismatch endonuclease, patch repair protein
MAMSRSDNMRAIRSKDMLPELTVRRLLHRLGYRYRLHRKDLPGKPDLAFGPRRKVIFVHGCFWHGHNCKEGRIPKSNADYWLPKLQRNQARDKENIGRLTDSGWECLVIWECEMRDRDVLQSRLKKFLGRIAGRISKERQSTV